MIKEELELYSDYLYINYAKNTKNTYMKELERFIIFYELTNKELFSANKVTQLDIRDYEYFLSSNLLDVRSPLNPKKLSATTINKKIESLKNFFLWCEQEKLITTNPTTYLKNKRTEKREMTIKWLERSEKNKLIRVMNDLGLWKKEYFLKRNKAIVYLMMLGGLRISEVANLLKSDIDEKKMIMTIVGKGDKTRKVDINKELMRSIKEWLDVSNSDSYYLFDTQKGKKITTQAIQHIFEKLRIYTQIEGLTPHSLRHTFCHSLSEQGFSLTVIASLVGHENLETTRIYTTCSQAERKNAVDSLL